MKELKGRVAIVTGGGSGIGRATCERLAREGCDVAVVDRNEAGAAETALLVERTGRRASVHVADVASRTRMEALPAEVIAVHGRVHVLVNNAGVTVVRSFEEHSIDDLEWIIGVNLWGVIHGCKFFLPHLRAEDEAHIVNVSSLAGLLGLPMQSSYSATKFAVRGLSESLTIELADTKVGVTVLFPGPIRTSVMRSSRHDADGHVPRLAALLERHARPPSIVAERIVRAIRRQEAEVVIGAEAHIGDFMARWSKRPAASLLAWGFGRTRGRRP